MAGQTIACTGTLLGRRKTDDGILEIVHVQHKHPDAGPAENAFVMVQQQGEHRIAKYISWINYHDIEYAMTIESGWELIEPGTEYSVSLAWQPYGWDQAWPIPSLGPDSLNI